MKILKNHRLTASVESDYNTFVNSKVINQLPHGDWVFVSLKVNSVFCVLGLNKVINAPFISVRLGFPLGIGVTDDIDVTISGIGYLKSSLNMSLRAIARKFSSIASQFAPEFELTNNQLSGILSWLIDEGHLSFNSLPLDKDKRHFTPSLTWLSYNEIDLDYL